MKFKFNITGLDCPNCAAKLAAMMEGDAAVTSCKINFLTEKITVESELSGEALLPAVVETALQFSKKLTVELA